MQKKRHGGGRFSRRLVESGLLAGLYQITIPVGTGRAAEHTPQHTACPSFIRVQTEQVHEAGLVLRWTAPLSAGPAAPAVPLSLGFGVEHTLH